MLLQLLVAKVNAQLLERVVFEYLKVRGMKNRIRGVSDERLAERRGGREEWQEERQKGNTKAKTEE